MKKTIILFITLVICLCTSVSLSAKPDNSEDFYDHVNDFVFNEHITPVYVYWNNEYYSVTKAYYVPDSRIESEYTLLGEITEVLPIDEPFIPTQNGSTNHSPVYARYFEVGDKIYSRNSDKNLFVRTDRKPHDDGAAF